MKEGCLPDVKLHSKHDTPHHDNGSISLSADEHALALEALSLAKVLCLDMEADKHPDDKQLVEVRLLKIVEQLEVLWLVGR